MTPSEEDETALYEAFCSDHSKGMIAFAEDGKPSIEIDSGSGCLLWQGYLDASHILPEEIFRSGRGSSNLIFPALFNLRHAMEFGLKWHIKYAGGEVPRHVGHNLEALVEIFRKTAEGLDEEASYISECLLSCVSELAAVDPHAIAFRYPTQHDGTPIEIMPKSWDLSRLYFSVESLLIEFDRLSGRIDLSRDEEYQAFLHRN